VELRRHTGSSTPGATRPAVSLATMPRAAPEVPALVPVPIDPAWVFGQAVANRVTGVLRTSLARTERAIYFDRGHAIVATSNVPAERIGRVLLADGILGPQELESFLALSAKSGLRLAELLVQKGALTATDRLAVVQRQYVDRVLRRGRPGR
jgi:hypothetical protein